MMQNCHHSMYPNFKKNMSLHNQEMFCFVEFISSNDAFNFRIVMYIPYLWVMYADWLPLLMYVSTITNAQIRTNTVRLHHLIGTTKYIY